MNYESQRLYGKCLHSYLISASLFSLSIANLVLFMIILFFKESTDGFYIIYHALVIVVIMYMSTRKVVGSHLSLLKPFTWHRFENRAYTTRILY